MNKQKIIGNVGIGTVSPSYKLDVSGDVNTSDCYKEAGSQVAGTCASDIRLKKDIRYFSGSLEKINALKLIKFKWKTKEFSAFKLYSGAETGLIAQDVEKIFPHLVKTGKNGYKKVKYGMELRMHVIQAIRELKAQNDTFYTVTVSTGVTGSAGNPLSEVRFSFTTGSVVLEVCLVDTGKVDNCVVGN